MDAESLGWIPAAAIAWWMGAAASGIRRELVQLEESETPEADYDTLSHLQRFLEDRPGLGLRLRFARLVAAVVIPLAGVMMLRTAGLGWAVLAAFVGWFLAAAADVSGGSPLGHRVVRFPAGHGLEVWQRLTAIAPRLLRPVLRRRTRAPREEPGGDLGAATAEVPLGREERRILRRLLASTAILVSDIMTRWSDVQTVTRELAGGALEAAFRASGRSRLPVVDGDRVVGLVTVKDVLARRHRGGGAPFAAEAVMRPVYFVRRETRVQDLLEELRDARTHFAVVVDPLGRAVGIVTVEDVLEEIVGELYDEREAPR